MTKIGLIIVCAYNVTAAQSQQVTMEIAMVFDAPYVGPINREEKIIFGPNIRHSVETTKSERFYARRFVNESKGKIIGCDFFGKQSKKWVTTFTNANGNQLILEEWSVSELPALRLADSLNRALELKLGKPDSIITSIGKGFFNMMIMMKDAPNKLEKIPGEIIKASIKSYKKDEKEPNFSMSIKITRLDSKTLKMNHFRVPEDYISFKK